MTHQAYAVAKDNDELLAQTWHSYNIYIQLQVALDLPKANWKLAQSQDSSPSEMHLF